MKLRIFLCNFYFLCVICCVTAAEMDFLRSSREKINFSPIPLPLRIATGLKQIIVFKWAIEWYWSPPLAASTEEHFFQNFHIIARLSRAMAHNNKKYIRSHVFSSAASPNKSVSSTLSQSPRNRIIWWPPKVFFWHVSPHSGVSTQHVNAQ